MATFRMYGLGSKPGANCHFNLKVLGKSVVLRVECKSAKLWGEMVKELSDGVTETQILQKL